MPTQLVATSSEYFELHSIVRNERLEFTMDSVFKRTSNQVTVITRKRHNFDG
ncbi:MAG: hypothetical protein EXR86_06815 [Gammaproteobacteria bacterium]|nr:hypothetical protein [Gammaproteobacteria bacterium]